MSALSQPGETTASAATEGGDGALAWLFALLFRDLKTKGLALLFAVLVWVYINAEITTETTLTIPVQIEIDSQSVMVTNITPKDLTLVLAGPKEKISQLQAEMLVRTLKIRAADLPEGEDTRSLERSPGRFFKLPPGIKLRQQPVRVRVTVVRAVTRSLKVVARFKQGSQPAPGFEIKKLTFSPTDVRIRGPITVMQHLSKIQTQAIDISGRRTTAHINVDVQKQIKGEQINYLELEPVSVTIEIGPIQDRLTLELKRMAVQVRFPFDFPYLLVQVKETKLTVHLTGMGTLTEDDKQKIYVEADLAQLGSEVLAKHFEGTNYRIVVRGLPPGFTATVLHDKDLIEKVYIKLAKKKKE